MKTFFLTVLFILGSSSAFASSSLRPGDVILQPLKCWACSLIEGEENSEFSHIGIAIEKNGRIKVAEAYGEVRIVSLSTFLSKTHPEKKVKVLRLKSQHLDPEKLLRRIEYFEGNPYDPKFLWNNYINSKEAIYCSELVYKVLIPQVKFEDLFPKRMLFDNNPELWDRYFRGKTPRGEIGISPEDFNRSTDFEIKEIEGI